MSGSLLTDGPCSKHMQASMAMHSSTNKCAWHNEGRYLRPVQNFKLGHTTKSDVCLGCMLRPEDSNIPVQQHHLNLSRLAGVGAVFVRARLGIIDLLAYLATTLLLSVQDPLPHPLRQPTSPPRLPSPPHLTSPPAPSPNTSPSALFGGAQARLKPAPWDTRASPPPTTTTFTHYRKNGCPRRRPARRGEQAAGFGLQHYRQ
jgi:hypothetical protein